MRVGMLAFPDMTQLDFTGPHEVFAQLPGTDVRVVAPGSGPVTARGGLRILPDLPIEAAPPFDLVFVPGGPGVGALLEDLPVLHFLRRQAQGARWVTSVCTGALVLGAAGLLRGYRATTHWLSLDLLPVFGATRVRQLHKSWIRTFLAEKLTAGLARNSRKPRQHRGLGARLQALRLGVS